MAFEKTQPRKHFDSNPMRIKEGDLVLIDLSKVYSEHRPAFQARILRVQTRFRSNLVKYRYVKGVGSNNEPAIGYIDHCDISFCKEVLERASRKGAVLRNCFFSRNERNRSAYSSYWRLKDNKGFSYCSPHELAMIIASSKPYWDVMYGFDEARLYSEWQKAGCPGRVQDYEFSFRAYVIRIKTFKKWLTRNLPRVTCLKSEWIKGELAYEREMDEQYVKEMELEWESESDYEDVYWCNGYGSRLRHDMAFNRSYR